MPACQLASGCAALSNGNWRGRASEPQRTPTAGASEDAMLVDTLKASKRLIKAGLSEDQAEAIIATVTDSRETLATRADIESLRSELPALELRLVKWYAAGQAATIALVVALIKLL